MANETWTYTANELRYYLMPEGLVAAILADHAAAERAARLTEYVEASNGHYCDGMSMAWSDAQEAIGRASDVEERAARLEAALQALYDEQNGPPLLKHQDAWEAAMKLARAALTPPASSEEG